MSWTYDDDWNEAAYKWAKLPESRDKDRLATVMMKRMLAILSEDCGFVNVNPGGADKVRPKIPKELR